ncbi:DNA topoisomerase III (plasmid) [Shewanella sp. SNU WT4]|uniref:DNA topoisomerase 3 n=1 Tax=Shewanella sp. SNU WT4 TaxID=2590015 RepID=UPI0011281FB2|nr:DNA topoisomerase 3 [Shewanella sp. SNU WT4]QDF68705.1 DNA topoisomerase III [Shewanella sp. SNU WT4]
MRLFIAEKPSVAKAIAAELGITETHKSHLICGGDVVTWCFGHMLELAEPDDYTPADVPSRNGKKIWRVDELPIIPANDNWILKPKPDAEFQLKQIGKFIKQANTVVNAGDPDREGQLLIDEVLDFFGNQSPVLRYWANAIDPVSVKRALTDLKNNADYLHFGQAAIGRQRADWLIGMNLSRAMTLRAERGGSHALLTVGRVQSPVLALVVGRDRQIETFTPIPFHTLKASISHEQGNIEVNWKAGDEQTGLDEEGRLTNTAIADALVSQLTGANATVLSSTSTNKVQTQPLTFALSDITLIASNKFGYSAEEVLNTCQSLYEKHKLTTYPRSDCAYLPESQFNDAAATLEAIKQINPELAALIDNADPRIKSKTWNDKKVTAHHGIIPTMHIANKAALSEPERNIYNLVVRAYIAQFYPGHEYASTSIDFSLGGELFATKGKVITLNGWKDVYQIEEKEDSEQPLPKLSKGDSLTCHSVTRRDSKTKPPSRFTEGTLIQAMKNIHKFVEEADNKKMLKEEDGLGTEATRASIISELKRREYLIVNGKQISSTTIGRSLIDSLDAMVKSPVLTALFERMLKNVELGTMTLDDFVNKQVAFVTAQVQKANQGSVKIAGAKPALVVSDVHKCAACGAGLIRRPSSKKRGAFWWGCSNNPTCTQMYPDAKGRPNYQAIKTLPQPQNTTA